LTYDPGTTSPRAARTGFWLSLFRFQGATGHSPNGVGAGSRSDPRKLTHARSRFSPLGGSRQGRFGGKSTVAGAPERVNRFGGPRDRDISDNRPANHHASARVPVLVPGLRTTAKPSSGRPVPYFQRKWIKAV